MVDVRPLIDGKNSLGEGPLWHVAEQKLYWIDSLDRWIFRIDADGRTTMGKFSPGVADFFDKNPVPAGKTIRPGEFGVGALFAIHGLGVKGIAEPRFAG